MFGKRMLAYLIDNIIAACIIMAVMISLISRMKTSFSIPGWGGYIVGGCINGFMFFIFDYLMGRSPGKRIVGIKIINPDGTKPDAYMSFIRALVKGIAMPWGALTCFFADTRPALHDFFGGTIVVAKDFAVPVFETA
ncbi:putative RDD family membrane protein YckC [Elusimicrobium simillimum]|uniref:RDD family protein n=1 Tax=Elusimicrobium simillimum TaxID=3143438 RepID=UPI003C6F0987